MIYLFYGEDNFLIEREVNKIKKEYGDNLTLGINYIKLSEDNIEELIEDAETPAFGYPKKLIICKNAGLFKKKKTSKNSSNEETSSEVDSKFSKKLTEYFEENIENINDSCDIIIIEESATKTSKLYKAIEKSGIVKEFPLKKDYEVARDLVQIASLYKVKLDISNANYLVSSCGTNMQELINEIRKLIEYVGANGTITKEDIDKLTIRKSEAVIFDLTDFLGNRNAKAAIKCYRDLVSENVADQVIIVMIYRHIKNLYIYKLSKPEDVSKNLNLKPNQTFLPKIYARQAKLFSIDELKQILYELIYIDESTKNGNLDSISLGLESIMCRYF